MTVPDNWVIIPIKLRIGSQITGYNSARTEKSGFYIVLMVVTVEV